MSDVAIYEKMKDSKERWLGDIPYTWNTRLLKYMFSIKKNIAGETGHQVLSVTQKGIVPKNMTERGQFSLDYSKYQLVEAGDFVMNHMDLLTGWVDISKYNGVTSPDYRVFVNTNPDSFDSQYYKYIFQYCYSNRIFYGLGQGVAGYGRWRLPADMFMNFVLPVPPIDQQRRISCFLDKQCAHIDSFIEETKRTIEEYKSWKSSIILETVTKGIEPNRRMKKCDLEWISEIPATWKTDRLKTLFTFGKGLPITKESLVDQGTPVISYGQIHAKYNTGTSITEALFRYVPESYIESNPDSLVHKGDILVADTSEDIDGCGNSVYIDKEMPLFAGYHTIILKSINQDDNKYLAYLFKSHVWRSQIRTRVSGVKLFSISKKILTFTTVILPPKEEQEEITRFLDEKCKLIDTLIENKQALMIDLETYKRSLIYEVVTGKRKVV